MFITGEESNYDCVFEDLLTWYLAPGGKCPSDVTFFGQTVRVTEKDVRGLKGPLDSIGGILVLRYLIVAGSTPLTGEWVPYRALPDGATFAQHIKSKIEDHLAALFSGKREVLAESLGRLGGKPLEFPSNPDLCVLIEPLPHVPLLCLFWDRDDEFPASFQFLVDRSAPDYLDLESLAVLFHYARLLFIEPPASNS